jgi:hypothetical protein
MAMPDSLAAASFSWPMSWNSARSTALGASPALAMRSVRMRITEPEDSSISWVLSARSNHCVSGFSQRIGGREAAEVCDDMGAVRWRGRRSGHYRLLAPEMLQRNNFVSAFLRN